MWTHLIGLGEVFRFNLLSPAEQEYGLKDPQHAPTVDTHTYMYITFIIQWNPVIRLP